MCDLCNLYKKREIITKFYFEHKNFICVDCVKCKVPMIVLKEHRNHFTKEELQEIHYIANARLKLFNRGKPDFTMRTMREHVHCHLRIM